jgi:hypothetical protein
VPHAARRDDDLALDVDLGAHAPEDAEEAGRVGFTPTSARAQFEPGTRSAATTGTRPTTGRRERDVRAAERCPPRTATAWPSRVSSTPKCGRSRSV